MINEKMIRQVQDTVDLLDSEGLGFVIIAKADDSAVGLGAIGGSPGNVIGMISQAIAYMCSQTDMKEEDVIEILKRMSKIRHSRDSVFVNAESVPVEKITTLKDIVEKALRNRQRSEGDEDLKGDEYS